MPSIYLYIILGLFATHQVFAKPIVIEREDFESLPIHNFADFVKDSAGVISPQELLARPEILSPITTGGRNFESTVPHWIRVSIDSRLDKEIEAILVHNIGTTAVVEVYESTRESVRLIEKNGFKYPFSNRAIEFRKPSISVQLRPGLNTFIIKVHTQGILSLYFTIMNPKDFTKYFVSDSILLWFIFGVYVFAISYNCLIYLHLRSKSYLYYCGLCILQLGLFIVWTGIAGSMLPNLYGEAKVQLCTIIMASLTTIFSYLFAIEFLKLKDYAPLFAKLLRFFSLVYCFIIGLTFLENFGLTRVGLAAGLCTIIPIFTSPMIIFAALKCYFKGYKPAAFFVLAWTPWVVLIDISLIVAIGLIPWIEGADLFPMIGGAAETCLLSLALGYRVKLETDALHMKLRHHIGNLDHLVSIKSAKIKYIMDHVGVGIFKVNSNMLVDAEYSKRSLEIFGVSDLSGKNIADLLANSGQQSQSDQQQAGIAAISACIGEKSLSFELNAHLFPDELVVGKKIVELDWSPIIIEDRVEEFIVTSKDISYQKAIEKDNLVKNNELFCLKLITEVGVQKLRDYINSELDLLAKLNEMFYALQGEQSEFALASILRSFHTIKGNARIYNLAEVATLIHLLENDFLQAKSLDEKRQKAIICLAEISAGLRFYKDIILKYFPVEGLGRSENDIKHYLSNIVLVADECGAKNLAPVRAYFQNIIGVSLSEIVDGMKAGMSSIAAQLGKAEAKIVVNDEGYYLRKMHRHRMMSVLAHLLRNSLDHGIEFEGERMKSGKKLGGKIAINVQKLDERFYLHYSDDGKGLDMASIYRRLRSFEKSASLSNLDVARAIFNDGFTTKTEATEISGRGVGMSAIVDTLKEFDSEIDITFVDAELQSRKFHENELEYIKFKFVITFPLDIFI